MTRKDDFNQNFCFYLDVAIEDCPSGCNCVEYNKCNWSNQLILVLDNHLREYTHSWNWHFWLFRQNICDWKERKICCCGSEELPPEKVKPIQDCKWGEYHATECSKSCGGGVQNLKRIKIQRARYGKAQNIISVILIDILKIISGSDTHIRNYY